MNSPIVIIYNIMQKLYYKLYDVSNYKWIDIILAIIITGLTLLVCLRLLEYITKTLAMSIL